MAELTVLDEKLAEVLGLAQAAQLATKKVSQLAKKEKDQDLVALLTKMSAESEKTEKACQKVADTRDGLKTAITKKARETKGEVTGFMKDYLEGGDALDGLEFLTMAEAGELIHWEILATLNETAGNAKVRKLVADFVPVQQAHVAAVRDNALRLAADEDPAEAA